MTFHPNRAQWLVIWSVAIVVLGLWLATAPWDNLSIPTYAEQAAEYDRNPPTTTVRGRDGQPRVITQLFHVDRRGDAARETVRNRVMVATLVIGGLLVWQLAGKRSS